jgi:GPH family glycoside/pentoside/hexuronide:cation symporter
MARDAAPAKLPVRTKLLYGLGSMSDGAQLQLVGGVLLLYYNQIQKMPAQWVSLALGIALFVDAFWDAFIGYVSDNLRTRLGRRHPLMYFAVLPAGLAFAALWLPPEGLSQPQLFAWLLFFVIAFRMSHSCFMVPAWALTPELAPDYHERTVVIGYRWMLGASGGAITAVLVYGVFFHKTAQFPLGQLNPAGYPPMAIVIGLFISATILIATLGTHSYIAQLYRPAVRRISLTQSLKEVAATFGNHNFKVSLAAGALGATSVALGAGLTIYFNTYLFELPASSILLTILPLFVSGPLAFLIAPAVSRRIGKRAGCMTLFFTSLAFTHGPIVLRLLNLLPPNHSTAILPILMGASTVSGILAMGGWILSSSMIADITEESQLKTGRRSEALLYYADQLLNKVVSGMATILPGLLLAFVAFPPHATPATLDPAIMRHLAMAYVLIAATLSGISIGMWRFYRIDQAAHQSHLETLGDAVATVEAAGLSGAPSTAGSAPGSPAVLGGV